LIEEYSRSGYLIKNWTTDNRHMTPFHLGSATNKVIVSVCPDLHVNFTVGKMIKHKSVNVSNINIVNNF